MLMVPLSLGFLHLHLAIYRLSNDESLRANKRAGKGMEDGTLECGGVGRVRSCRGRHLHGKDAIYQERRFRGQQPV